MSKLLAPLVVLLFLMTSTYSSYAQRDAHGWQQRVDYTISAKLDDATHTIDGQVQIYYRNFSPDTLRMLWIHLWPNAYKNDRTAFSEQLLRNGRTDFYFASAGERGYINKLYFTVNGTPLTTEDHPQYIDAVKLILTNPLLPGDSVLVETPFHVQLPKLFSRSGYNGRGYAITQWYPKAAVYDTEGWHVMPYLDQGEYYNNFGRYDITLQVPDSFTVAASGELLTDAERQKLIHRQQQRPGFTFQGTEKRMGAGSKKPVATKQPVRPLTQEGPYKSLHYVQDSIHDFAWFASKYFIVDHDTVKLHSGRQVDVFTYYYPEYSATWSKAVSYARDALRFRSDSLFEYPYTAVSVVQSLTPSTQGMEYPMVTFISSNNSSESFDFLIQHEIGHNWFQGMIASDERRYPWMDEGMNSFFDRKYMRMKYRGPLSPYGALKPGSGIARKLPRDPEHWLLSTIRSIGAAQPINTSSENFSSINYGLIPYLQAAEWLDTLEVRIGTAAFRQGMNSYLQQYRFRPPRPADFQQEMQSATSLALAPLFRTLDSTPGFIRKKRSLKPTFGFNFSNASTHQYLNIFPLPGYNRYDKFMAGMMFHNYNLPVSRFQFLALPYYATGSKKFNYLAHADYTWKQAGWDEKLVASIDLQSFSKNATFDSLHVKQFERYRKVVPSITYQFRSSPGSSVQKFIRFKTYFIGERDFNGFGYHAADSLFIDPFIRSTGTTNFYVNELSFVLAHNRALYPNDWLLQWQQGNQFMRFNATGNYFFNYRKAGGLAVRIFASKFLFTGSGTSANVARQRFQPKLLGTTGEEDFTYSNYFFGRSSSYANATTAISNSGFAAQQIMIRDGGFKMRLDYFDFLQGRSDNWITSINLNTTLPSGIFPVRIPLKLFFDIGTASGNWSESYSGARFMYVGGLQLSLFRSIVNLYAPLVYSSDIRDNLKSVPEINSFAKRVTFSIDIQRINLRRFTMNQIPF